MQTNYNITRNNVNIVIEIDVQQQEPISAELFIEWDIFVSPSDSRPLFNDRTFYKKFNRWGIVKLFLIIGSIVKILI